MTPDTINGVFEIGGALTGLLNCYQIYKDREVRGVIWQLALFYSAWGLWNLYYYPTLGQWASFYGGVCVVTFNITWLCQVVYYLRLKRRLEKDK